MHLNSATFQNISQAASPLVLDLDPVHAELASGER
jgi:hypothetical protein